MKLRAFLLSFLLVGLFACNNTAQNEKTDAQEATEEIQQEMNEAADEVEEEVEEAHDEMDGHGH